MICASCGGQVEWQGPLPNLTHTKCLRCGAVNNQVVEDDYDPSYDDFLAEEARDV